ncbi:MAG: guanylate kinase [Candidatus Aminicenantes bacterium]|nr:guanylate kinase [Candidatus Aminicenantes bacterium]
MIFVISGPSGCGKSTLVQHAQAEIPDLEFSVSHTTRLQRDAEEEGKDYYFISAEEFKRMIAEEKFAEWALVHGHYYGTAKKELERKGANKDLILDVDVQGADQLRQRYKKGQYIFILPPSYGELRKRLEKRGQESQESIRTRLATARKEIRSYAQFDYIIVNDLLDDAVKDLIAILRSSKCRLEKRQKTIVPILQSFTGSG